MHPTLVNTTHSTHNPQVQRLASLLAKAGPIVALAGVILPLFLIGILKFTAIEIEELKPLINGTPWLSWLYPVFGEAGASYLLGVVEIIAAILLLASPWSARAAVAGGAIASVIFITTVSIMLALPIWADEAGGFPWLGDLGAFLIKDIAMLGVSLVVFAEGLTKLLNKGRQQ